MIDHLRYRATLVETRSRAGEFTEKALLLNDQRTVEYRQMVLTTITIIEETIQRIRESLKAIDRKAGKYPDRETEFTEQKVLAQRRLSELEHHLEKLAGISSPKSSSLQRKNNKVGEFYRLSLLL